MVMPAEQSEGGKAVVYARVSSKEQEEEGYSIPSQLKLLRRYAESKAITVVREYVDVETAKVAGRTGFGEMLAFLKRAGSECRVVLVEKTDRLYRNLRDVVDVDDLDLDIHLVKEGSVLSKDSRSSEKLMHGIRVVMAKHFIDNLREEVVKGMAEKVSQGYWPHKAPIGYRNAAGPDGRRIIEQDPEVAPIVRRMFERFATGNYSCKQVTILAKEEGLVFRKSRLPIPISTIHKALRSPLFKGEVTWAGRCYPGAHEPLVSADLWDRVQATLARRVHGTGRKNGRNHPYAAFLKCGHCGCALVPEAHKGGRHVYYHCSFARGKCPGRWLRQDELEGLFGDYLRRLRFDPEVLEEVQEVLAGDSSERNQIRQQAITRLSTEIRHQQSRLDVLYDDRLDGRIDEATYDRKSATLRTEVARLKRDLERARAPGEDLLPQMDRLLELSQRALDLYVEAPGVEKRKLVNLLLSNARRKDGALLAEYRQPFGALAVAAEAAGAAGGLEGPENEKRRGWYP